MDLEHTALIDITKPMRIHFTHSNYVVDDAFIHGPNIYARPNNTTVYHCFSFTGEGDHVNHRLVNEPEPKRTFTQKLAWIEYWNQVSAVTITESMERFGVEKYLRQYIPGKCIAITEVSFTEGDGNPPTY